MEFFDQKKPSTCQAGSNKVSFVHICSLVQELFAHKGKNLCSFIYIEIDTPFALYRGTLLSAFCGRNMHATDKYH